LITKYPDRKVVLAGDSAGGGLAMVTAIAARWDRLRLPAALLAFSPWCDLTCSSKSIEANARRCAMFTPKGIRQAATLYLPGSDPRDPRASPLNADLTGLPPMLLFASNDESLLDDTLRLAERARAAGVDVELVRRDRLPHVWPLFVHLLPEARAAVAVIGDFMERLGLVPHDASRPASSVAPSSASP